MTIGIWIFIVGMALVSILSIAAIILYDFPNYEEHLKWGNRKNDKTHGEEKKDG